ncbi:MAG: DEAD/DEAH box helicase, partial [Polyangiaceae bacterium]|nr:DEAD/DEAH box helicase [Polyangiaceae bacterium]
DLLAAVFPSQVACQENATGPREIPDHPLVRQTLDDCLFEAMDTRRLEGLLARMESGDVRLHARDTTEPSPFAHEILSAKPYAFLDDAPLEERRTRAVSLRRTLPEHQRDLGALDAAAIDRVVAEARHEPRDADELHDVLLGLGVAPALPEWRDWLDALARTARAAMVSTPAGPMAFAAELRRLAAALYPGRPATPRLAEAPPLDGAMPREAAVLDVVRGHAEALGPFTEAWLAERLALEPYEVRVATATLEHAGVLLRGRFRPGAEEDEVCDRRLLARIHRLTLDRLRSEIAPVSAQDFLRYVFDRHHLSARARTGGRAGLRDAIELLQGFEIAAAAWESAVLPARVAGYRTDWLDELCLAGEVGWARLSPRRAAPAGTPGAASPTSRATPIALAFRRDLGWLMAAVRAGALPDRPAAGAPAAVLEVLERRGALFHEDLAEATRLPGSELHEAILDLVGRGLVAGDGFALLRDLLGRRRPLGRRRGVPGRLSILGHPGEPLAGDDLADRVAGQLLARYGVVFRELSARETFAVPWRLVARALRRREARGTVRGGRFVAGFTGEQFALPEAVEALRRVRRTERDGLPVRIRAADPCNLVGIVTPGPRVPSNHGPTLVFVDGGFVGSDESGQPAGEPTRDPAALVQ